MEEARPKVGVGVLVVRDGKVLLGKRKSDHGIGEYAQPGGHLEYMESFADCAKREVKEETGMEIDNVRFLSLFNQKQYGSKHYVRIGLIADWKSGDPQVMEPEHCEAWGWYDVHNLPQPLYGTVVQDIESYKTGKNYYDA